MPPGARWYALRHPEPFDEPTAQVLWAGGRLWVATLNAHVREAAHLYPNERPPEGAPAYRACPEGCSADRRVITLRIEGGPDTYGWLKRFEDDFPADFYHYLPLWRQLDLELGRRDQLGFFPNWLWRRLHAPEAAARLRGHALFQRPGR